MQPIISTAALVLLSLLSLSTLSAGHLIMQQPVPYSADSLNNSPLANAAPGSAGSDFPCKIRDNAFEVGTENMITVGQPNTISWTGSASHGGGTCQLSVTLDRTPTANSQFKVIASWIGGCPTTGDGNNGTHPFNWTMPPEVPNGQATFAWSWISRISGNHEYYMNCAPVTVSGGANNTEQFDELEDLFLINLPSSNCENDIMFDLEIPNPGKYVTTFQSTSLALPTGTGCAAMGQAVATGGAQSTDATTTAAAVSGVAATFTAAPSSSQLSFVTPSASASDTTTVYATTMLTLTGATTTTSSPASTLSTDGSGSVETGSSSASISGIACSTDGALVCNGTDQFGLCNFGAVIFQPVAAGTTCQSGQIMRKRDVVAWNHARRSRVGK